MRHPEYAPDDHGREVEQAIIRALLGADDGTRWTRAELQARLTADAQAIDDALAQLAQRGVIQIDGDTIECPDSDERRLRLDLLSGVVVHVLVSAHPAALTVGQVAQECERDLDKPDERQEIELALSWIAGDELAVRRTDGWLATRPAVRGVGLIHCLDRFVWPTKAAIQAEELVP